MNYTKADCVYYTPPTYAYCSLCKIGGYCNIICGKFKKK